MNRTAIVISTPPYGNARGREALDAALALSVHQRITLIFLGDGVFHLRKNQSPTTILQRDYIAALGLLELYDIQACYACQEDMLTRHITEPLVNVQSKNRDDIATLLDHQDAILRF